MVSKFENGIPVQQFVSRFQSYSSKFLFFPCLLMSLVFMQWLISIGSYSGRNSPPMYGDFEAQRHWMELTLHSPVSKWYFEDLEWWGLDYPPLTAYVSLLFGFIGHYFFDPKWFAHISSRGFESLDLKLYMRATVILSHLLILVPPLIFYSKWWSRRVPDFVERNALLVMVLFQPALLLIDHGHFQYNCVMLGLVMYAIANLLKNQYVIATFLFCLALSFKQMTLYFAPSIFAYLLGVCFKPHFQFSRLLGLGITVITTFCIVFSPWIYIDFKVQLPQVVHRMFPFARGLFEDKVANFWCAVNTLFKVKEYFTMKQLQSLSLLFTLISILPSCSVLFLYPRKRLLALGFANAAWGFFLFSFQVHEKSVLIPLLLTSVILCHGHSTTKSWIALANNVGMFSLWPLLKKDNLGLQFFTVLFMWNWIGHMFVFSKNIIFRYLQISFYLAMVILFALDIFVAPPSRYPDLWVVLNVILSFAGFLIIYLWTLSRLLYISSKLSTDLGMKKRA
ncbi:glucosyltransferase Alg6 [Schizosaccharomyces octosporus yFS286]|uniref:Alpha-1,3-glucosyltransferase n=1 Tax=Schizosaccharomyces octosporus (strain yFS286) TaxID=483514 RepID=S9RGF1_SCHOY|nr:glucosyltransferase Alg6 [Schizosaccharomyces octosporus yFS286]EPX73124.1 glucosyltransferase Alg6 [Schizosaccharomyces octosporus yFS286]